MASLNSGSGLMLDETGYRLDEEESAFYKAQTGLQDDEALKDHLVRVQAEALAVHPYACIRHFRFTKLKISRLLAYPDLLKLGQEREGAIFLDIGCCFGNDVRKAVADGYPVQNVVASDLRPEFWQLGYKLFNDSPSTFPVPFIPGDIFSPDHLTPLPPFTATSPPTTPSPSLSPTPISLNPLRGHVSAIHASSFFHLFDEEQQYVVAKALACLLSPKEGSMIFGQHVGSADGPNAGRQGKPRPGRIAFGHSKDSWEAVWDGGVFEKGTVKMEARWKKRVEEIDEIQGSPTWLLDWRVMRL